MCVAEAIQTNMMYEDITVKIWTNGIFKASSSTCADLVKAANQSDFALLILSGDDITRSRGSQQASPRDNVVFELGLFIGSLGIERTVILEKRGESLKIPSDIIGVTPLEYIEPASNTDLLSALGPACSELKKLIRKMGPLAR